MKIIKTRLWRFVHNCIAHPAMEFLPERAGTAFHDWTAEMMDSDR